MLVEVPGPLEAAVDRNTIAKQFARASGRLVAIFELSKLTFAL